MATWKKVITDGADLSDIGTPASDDKLLIQDTSDSNVVKYVDWADVGGGSDVVNDTTPQLGGDLDANGYNLDMTSNTASTLVITANQYAFRYKSTGGVLQNTGLFFNATTGQYEFLNSSGNCIFCIKAGTGELSIGDMSGTTYFTLPIADGTANQVLQTDGSGNVDWATISASDTHLGNANLTANANRTYDTDGNTLTIDINGGDFTVSDSSASDTYIQAGSNVIELGDGAMEVRATGKFYADAGIEHDEANLTTAGAYGAGAEITYLGSSSSTTTTGRIYYYNGTTWAFYSPSTEAAQKALLGIAMGTTMSKGFLLKGFVNPNGATGFTTASPVYGATNASATTTVPTSGYQRVMGHSISTSVMFFNPSQEYIDLA